MAAHDHVDFDAHERAIVEVVAHEGLRHEFGRRAKPRAMIGDHEIVVDRLWDMDDAQIIVVVNGYFVNDVRRLCRVIAADIEEVADVVLLEDFEHCFAMLIRRLEPPLRIFPNARRVDSWRRARRRILRA